MPHDRDLTRREVLRSAAAGGLGVPLLAACAGAEETPSAAEQTPSPTPSPGSGAGSPTAEASTPAAQGPSVAAADVPVGGGTILTDDKLVVTQPAEGEFKAFSSVCTHKGCPVSAVTGGEILCQCHGSRFSIEDGSVLGGPASGPLESKTATLDGDQVTVT